MIELIEEANEGLVLRAHGLITGEDYRRVVPAAKRIIAARGSFSAVVDVTQVSGLSFGAIWEDVKFDVQSFRKTTRIAYLGPKSTWLWLTSIPFATHGVRFFPLEKRDEARAWAFGRW